VLVAYATEDTRDLPLGALVVLLGLATPADVEEALVEARRNGRRLGEVLIAWHLVDERQLGKLLAEQEDLPFLDLGKYDVDPEAAGVLPPALARKHMAVPFRLEDDMVLVALADPTDTDAIDALRAASSRRLRFVVATRSEVAAALAEAFGAC
jgi:hypothetical protein